MIIKPARGTQLNRTHPFARGLDGGWLFNEGVGDKVWDLSGNYNLATLAGAGGSAGWFAGADGFIYELDGGYFNIGANNNVKFLNGESWTLILKFRTNDVATDDNALFSRSNAANYQFLLRVDRGASPQDIEVRTNNIPSIVGTSAVINEDEWYFVAVTSNGAATSVLRLVIFDSFCKLLVNATGNHQGNHADVLTMDALIAGRQAGTQDPMDGAFDFAFYWNRQFSLDEIKQFCQFSYAMVEHAISPAVFFVPEIAITPDMWHPKIEQQYPYKQEVVSY